MYHIEIHDAQVLHIDKPKYLNMNLDARLQNKVLFMNKKWKSLDGNIKKCNGHTMYNFGALLVNDKVLRNNYALYSIGIL